MGNFLTIIIMKYEQRLRPFTKTLLHVQTFWDSVVLLLVGSRTLLGIFGYIVYRSDYWYFVICNNYLDKLSKDCAVWTLCALSLERMCLVMWPTNVFIRQVSRREALVLTFILVACSSVINVNWYIDKAYNRNIATYITLVYRVFIPSCLICISSGIIIYKIRLHFTRISPNIHSEDYQSPIFIIKMVLVIAVYYQISSILPLIYTSLGRYINEYARSNPGAIIHFDIISLATSLIFISNYALKFYLYTLSSRHMRQVLVEIINKTKVSMTKTSSSLFSWTAVVKTDVVNNGQ